MICKEEVAKRFVKLVCELRRRSSAALRKPIALRFLCCIFRLDHQRRFAFTGFSRFSFVVAMLLFFHGAFLAQAATSGCVAVPTGLVSWWPGDSNENDIVGGNNPSAVSAVSLVPGEVLTGFSFGTKGYILIPQSSTLMNQTFTWAAWVRPDGPGPNNDFAGNSILVQNIDNTHDSVALGWRATDNRFTFFFGDVTSTAGYIVSGNAFPAGTFYFIAATYDGSVFRLFVNGNLEASLSQAKTVAYSSSGWSIGSSDPRLIGLGFSRTWNGVIDEVQAFNRALSSSELQSIFNAANSGECKGAAATRILPQLAFGGGWYTALYFTNTTSSPVSLTVSFIGDDGNPLMISALGGSSVTTTLVARGTALIEAPNVGSLVVQGYVAAALPTGVTGYGVFRQSVPGINDQEAVVPLSGVTATTTTLVFDDTKYVTAVAVANLSSASNTITVVARDTQGNTIGTGTIPLAANAKTAVALKNIPGLAGVAGTTGSADFTVNIGNLAVLGLRFNGAAFTSIPTSDR